MRLKNSEYYLDEPVLQLYELKELLEDAYEEAVSTIIPLQIVVENDSTMKTLEFSRVVVTSKNAGAETAVIYLRRTE